MRHIFLFVFLFSCAGPASNLAPSEAPLPNEPPALELSEGSALRLDEISSIDEVERIQKADELVEAGYFSRALEAIGMLSHTSARLMKARALFGLNRHVEALDELNSPARDLQQLFVIERARNLVALEKMEQAYELLTPVMQSGTPEQARAQDTWVEVLLAHARPEYLGRFDEILKRVELRDVETRSRLWGHRAEILRELGRGEEAQQAELHRYLKLPVARNSPESPPVSVTTQQSIDRARVLLDAHRNKKVLQAVGRIDFGKLNESQRCEIEFMWGLAARKLRRYEEAENHLGKVTSSCGDPDIRRRAMFLQAKVTSIRAGLAAINTIERFAREFRGHSMVDDVLFWAGDLYQRRKLDGQAESYYTRIDMLPELGDHCAKARWRMAWMAYRRNDFAKARLRLERLLDDKRCKTDAFDLARANYWLAQVDLASNDQQGALEKLVATVRNFPLGFYAQLALARIGELNSAMGDNLAKKLAVPAGNKGSALCVGGLFTEPALEKGLRYMQWGLGSDAQRYLKTLLGKKKDVLAGTHAEATGEAAVDINKVKGEGAISTTCSESESTLLLVLLLDRAGDRHASHWRLRTEFAAQLSRFPNATELPIWRAAYPLAFREAIEPAEVDSKLPTYFLQALAREESALDVMAVSWAGAYGLTQLLLDSGQRAGKLLDPVVELTEAEELLEPHLNAKLGGALLGHLLHKFDGSEPLALAAYNAGDRVAVIWKKRHAEDPFDVFAEEMTIRETRGYVKRVLRTFGIYRWLYGGTAPVLATRLGMPPWDK
jgi:soluble lytic murein transglycosylase